MNCSDNSQCSRTDTMVSGCSWRMKFTACFITTVCFITITIDVAAACEQDWFGDNCDMRNVARGKATSQSSTLQLYGGPYPSYLAVDGNNNQDVDVGKSCSHTANAAQAWWKVQLGSEMYSISRMRIYLRNNLPLQTEGLQVYVDKQLCYTRIGTSSTVLDIKCTSTLRGNTVKVQIPGGNLALCEVEVYADCTDGYYGVNCAEQCGRCKNGDVCNKISGICQHGCRENYEARFCKDCIDKYYGQDCTKQCGRCKDNQTCDKTNGVCENGCQAQYEIPYCQDSLSEPSCHCASNCPQWHNTTCSTCKENWFGTYCQKYNIARGKNANQSSTYPDGPFYANLAVDGNTDNNFDHNSCTHTYNNNSWWYVILGHEKYNISEMKMFLRSDNHERNKELQVYVNDNLCHTLGNYKTSTLDITCDPVLSGNVVNVTIPGNILTLCEVQVFVCSDWWFGKDCDKQCQCSDTSEVCDKGTGYCRNGCTAGKYGDGCQKDCWGGQFGENCKKTCYCKNENDICDAKTGYCSSGCTPGKQGKACQQDCVDGFYGDNCASKCGRCKTGNPCNKTNGICEDGCKLGFETPKCQSCIDGYYDFDCKLCGRCKSDKPCNKTDGVCVNGCEENFDTSQCQTCAPGWFGHKCSSRCGQCKTHNVCDPTSGHCLGCKAGYMEPLCLQVCPPGRFGNNCSSECGHCNTDEQCDHVTGNCSQGCTAGYKEPQCLQVQQLSQTPSNTNAGLIGGLTVTFIVIIAAVVVAVIVIRRRRNRVPGARNDCDVNTGENGFNSISENNTSGKQQGAKSKNLKNNINKTTKSSSTDQTESSSVTAPDNVYENSSTYYNILPSPIPVAALERYIKDKLAGTGFEEEYKLLHYGLQREHAEGKKPENKKRNRFLELFPYDHSRVILSPDGDDKSDYINASFIAGFCESSAFIAAQGPNTTTVDDLWRMIWQENVSQIVMLTRLMELTKKKCEQYWPNDDEDKKCGNIVIKVKSTKVRADFTVREFTVRHNQKRRVVTQLHFTSWPDHDVPSPPALVGFWKQYRSLRQTGQNNTVPVVVHCSAGVGRTGTFIALDSLFDEAESADKVNVFTCVSKMREARMNMVQTASQYRFVHESLLEAIGSKDTLYTLPEFDREFGTGTSCSREQEVNMSKQFQSLESMRPSFKEEQVSEARLPENVKKNKNQAIVPANKTRPYLSTVVKGRNSYINAVVIPSATQPLALIATQTPLAETIVDFWRLVHDHDCFTIVCLDNMEGSYPRKDQPLECGPFRIAWCKEDTTCDSFMETHFTLALNGQTDAPLKITVYKPKSLITDNPAPFHQLVNAIDVTNVQDHKILVHCSDGSRLSGLFCSVLNIITRVKLDREVDIFLTIRELQCIRPHFIDSYDQYKLCYEMVKEHHRSTTVYANM